MAKSIQELLELKSKARAVPTRNVPVIDWEHMIDRLKAGETLVLKTDCAHALPKSDSGLRKNFEERGVKNVSVKRPIAEVVVLSLQADSPVVERSARYVAPTPVKRGPGRPRKNPLAAMGVR
jgi:hypothetical protein